MKKILVLFMMFTVILSCKDDQKKDTEVASEEESAVLDGEKTRKQSDGLIAIQGNYLFVEKDNAAVLQTPTQVYGVVVDDKVKALNSEVEKFKSEPYQMVPVTVRGRIIKNEDAEDEWKNKIEIKEVLKVSEPNPEENDVIKLGSK